jgi:hypothetical protein
MRKLIFSAIMVATSMTMFAQNLDDVQEKISKGKFTEAQEKIDKVLSDAKGQKNANAWYYKGVVYYNLGLDSSKTDKDYKQESFDAFQKYYQLDTKNVMGNLEQNARLFQLYDTYYNAGIKAFNSNDFESSFKNFRNALNVESFITGKGFTYNGTGLPSFDTSLILNTAAAASKAKLQDSAMAYYQRIADAKLKGENYMEVYQMLVDYYDKKNDSGNKAKYLTIAKELYPNNDIWYEVELSPLRENKPKVFAKYEELISNNPGSYYLTYNYAVELYNYLYANEKTPADFSNFEPRMQGAIDNAIKANNNPDANLLMVRYLSEKIYKLEDSSRLVKGTKPEDAKKRQAFTAKSKQLWDQLLPYAEASFSGFTQKQDLKGADKGNLKFVSNVLIDYYNMKKQPDKAKSYEDKIKQFGL